MHGLWFSAFLSCAGKMLFLPTLVHIISKLVRAFRLDELFQDSFGLRRDKFSAIVEAVYVICPLS